MLIVLATVSPDLSQGQTDTRMKVGKLKSHGRYYSLLEFVRAPKGYLSILKFEASDKFKLNFYDRKMKLVEQLKYVPRTPDDDGKRLDFREFVHCGDQTYIVLEKEHSNQKEIYLGRVDFDNHRIGNLVSIADIERDKNSFWRFSQQKKFFFSIMENDWSSTMATLILQYSEENEKYTSYVQLYSKDLKLTSVSQMKIEPEVHTDILGAFYLKPGIPMVVLRLHDKKKTVRLYYSDSKQNTHQIDVDLGEHYINDFELKSIGTDIFLVGYQAHKNSELLGDFKWNYPSDSYHRPVSNKSDGLFFAKVDLRKKKVVAKTIIPFKDLKNDHFRNTTKKDHRTDEIHLFETGHLVLTSMRADMTQKGEDLLRNVYNIDLTSFTLDGKFIDATSIPVDHKSSDFYAGVIEYKGLPHGEKLHIWMNGQSSSIDAFPDLKESKVHYNYQGNTSNELQCWEYDFHKGSLKPLGYIPKFKKNIRISPYFMYSEGKSLVGPGMKVFKSNAIRVENPFIK